MIILGISSFYHDSAASILKDGLIIAAAQEERFSRIKHDENFPVNAIKFCIKECSIDPKDIDYVVFYEKPFIKFERLLETYLAFAPRGFKSFCRSITVWIKDKLFQKSVLIKNLQNNIDKSINWNNKLLFSEHHLSHASSAFFPSPYERSAILTLDGVGEWTTASIAIGNKNQIKILKEIHFPHSLGLLYSAFTYYAGFKVNSGEYKLMGLAPYGEPIYANLIKENLINIADDGSFQINMKYFNYATGFTMTNKKFNNLFGGKPRSPEAKITKKDMDLAASIQKITEEIVVKIAKNIKKITGEENLCLAGGVALNCVANGVLIKEKIFKNIWIQPASGDAGGALGAALAVWNMYLNNDRVKKNKKDSMHGAYLGPKYSQIQIKEQLNKLGAKYRLCTENQMLNIVTDTLVNEKAIGWMQGKMEFGPRALGGRSIIADPRSKIMQKQLNLKVKFRESFRPFAPSILFDDLANWFELKNESPYMLLVSKIIKNKRIEMTNKQKKLFGIKKLNIARSDIPAVTHVDYSARIQTVHKDTNPIYYKLLKKFKEKTGCPILVNTSFNIRGEPIVCSPTDAFKCFMGTDLDLLVIDNFVLFKNQQVKKLRKNYKKNYGLD